MRHQSNTEINVLRVPELTRKTGLSRTTIWRLERVGEFPKRRQIGPGSVGWLEREVNEWLENRPTVDGGLK